MQAYIKIDYGRCGMTASGIGDSDGRRNKNDIKHGIVSYFIEIEPMLSRRKNTHTRDP
jgi:hypothetical protein